MFSSSSSWCPLHSVWFPFTHTKLFLVVTSRSGFGFGDTSFRRAFLNQEGFSSCSLTLLHYWDDCCLYGPHCVWDPVEWESLSFSWGDISTGLLSCDLSNRVLEGGPPSTPITSFPYDTYWAKTAKTLSLGNKGGVVERWPSQNVSVRGRLTWKEVEITVVGWGSLCRSWFAREHCLHSKAVLHLFPGQTAWVRLEFSVSEAIVFMLPGAAAAIGADPGSDRAETN